MEGLKSTPHRYTFVFPTKEYERTNQDAPRNVYQKTVTFESPYGDEGGRALGWRAGAHRPAEAVIVVLWGVPAAMPERSRYARYAGVARSISSEGELETELPPAPGGVSPMRRAGGGLSVGRALGAGDHGLVPRGRSTGAGTELAGHGPTIQIELEERGDESCSGRWSMGCAIECVRRCMSSAWMK